MHGMIIIIQLYRLWCRCVRHTELLLLVTAVATVVLLVAKQAGEETVAVFTAELKWHLTGDVYWSTKKKKETIKSGYILLLFIKRERGSHTLLVWKYKIQIQNHKHIAQTYGTN